MMTRHPHRLAGLYYMQGFLTEVFATDDGLFSTMPGVPEGYETRVVPLGGNRFRMIGGVASGAVVAFVENEQGEVTGLQAGPMFMERVTSAENRFVPQRVAAPVWEISAEQQTAFDALLTTLENASGDWLDYNLPYPKYQFLQYASDQNRYIFHGSNNQTIDELAPIRQSVELGENSERGNVQGVYGTHEALWAMFFAIVHRKQLKGTIRNGVDYVHNAQGEALPLYNFSVDLEQLPDRPFCDGAMYILPRATFQQLPLWGDVLSNEWASEQAVKPLAKLRLAPADFPFLEQIQGHDDGGLLQMDALMDEIEANATAATLDVDRFTVWIGGEVDVNAYVGLQAIFMPDVSYAVEATADGSKLTASNLPPAMRQTLQTRFKSLLS